MKSIITAAILVFSGTVAADEYVNGYTRQDGTYVAPHMRSSPNDNRYDNYTTKGNVNPYTGQRGTQTGDNNLYQAPKPTPYHIRRSNY